MNEHRSAGRWFAGLLIVGGVLVGAMAPAQADTGWNGTIIASSTHKMQPSDTGWNGT